MGSRRTLQNPGMNHAWQTGIEFPIKISGMTKSFSPLEKGEQFRTSEELVGDD
jgi:hypothetical protein